MARYAAAETCTLCFVADDYRIGEAAKVLGVRVETLRRWERQGRIEFSRTAGGQRRVAASQVARLLSERRRADAPEIRGQSVRNHFPGVVVAVKKDEVAATVEIMAGPHRILSLLTREAVDELGLEPGVPAIAAVKATNVGVELPR
jgi:molybdopterin-binding protein